jgi:muramidase (phage lysozyme)
LGFSDHPAQIVRINIGKGNKSTKIVVRRQLTNNNIEELKIYYLRNHGMKYFVTQM